MDKAEKAKKIIEDALIIIKSVDFLEKQAFELLAKVNNAEDRLDSASNFQEKEEIMSEIESYAPKLMLLIRRCEIERENINKVSRF